MSNTLGTALGDYLADSSGLGFLGGAVFIASVLGVVLIATFYTRIDRIILFWVAFILTRPFGATFGYLLTKPVEKGGLNFGTIGSSAILADLLVVFITYTTIRDRHTNRKSEVERQSTWHTAHLPIKLYFHRSLSSNLHNLFIRPVRSFEEFYYFILLSLSAFTCANQRLIPRGFE